MPTPKLGEFNGEIPPVPPPLTDEIDEVDLCPQGAVPIDRPARLEEGAGEASRSPRRTEEAGVEESMVMLTGLGSLL